MRCCVRSHRGCPEHRFLDPSRPMAKGASTVKTSQQSGTLRKTIAPAARIVHESTRGGDAANNDAARVPLSPGTSAVDVGMMRAGNRDSQRQGPSGNERGSTVSGAPSRLRRAGDRGRSRSRFTSEGSSCSSGSSGPTRRDSSRRPTACSRHPTSPSMHPA
jgi:hypothetical protein